MKSLRDDQLLHRWAESRSQAAFSELGRRHAGMVYGVCLREIGSHAEAEDAAQAVFLLLAQKAPTLRKEGALTGWLFRAAQLVSRGARRQERRRVRREAQAGHDLRLQADAHGENALWDEVEPHLNDALARQRPAHPVRHQPAGKSRGLLRGVQPVHKGTARRAGPGGEIADGGCVTAQAGNIVRV